VRALQVTTQAAGVFLAAAQQPLRRIIIIFWNYDDAGKLPTFAEFVIAELWLYFLDNILPVYSDFSFVLL
jgi:hypothetical protein